MARCLAAACAAWLGVICLGVLVVSTTPAWGQDTGEEPLVPESEAPDDGAPERTQPPEAPPSDAPLPDAGGEGTPSISLVIPEQRAYSERIASVEVICDVPFCEDLENVAALERSTGLWAGQGFEEEKVDRARRRLLKTGYFARVTASVVRSSDGAVISFETEGRPVVHDIHFENLGALFESDVEKRLFLRPGRSLAPRPIALRNIPTRGEMTLEALASLALTDQADEITKLYAQEGYYDAVVDIRREVYAPYLIDLYINVKPGAAYALGKIYLRGHEAFTYAEIEDQLRSGFGFFANYTADQLREGIDEVIGMYREEGYIQARVSRVTHKVEERSVFDVFLEVQEGRRWSISFEGNHILDDASLNAALTFYDAGFIDEVEIVASIVELKALYETVGFYWAKIDYAIDVTDDKNGTLVFSIVEGNRAEIEAIYFQGNKIIGRDELSETISSSAYQVFGSGAFPQVSLIDQDAASIIALYQSKGYLLADVPRWSLNPGSTPERLVLTFVVEEGPPTHVRKVSINAPTVEGLDKALSAVRTVPAKPFSALQVKSDAARLVQPFRRGGYARAEVALRCSVPGEDGPQETPCAVPELPAECYPTDPGELCQRSPTGKAFRQQCERHYATAGNEPSGTSCVPGDGVRAEEVSVAFEITSGQRHFVGDFFLHGNFVTRDWVINQDFSFERGDPYDFRAMLDSKGRLRAHRAFSGSVETIGLEDADDPEDALSDVPLVIHVEESRRRWIDIAPGTVYVSGEWLATAEMEYTEANLLGTGWNLSFLFQPEFRFLNLNGEFVLTKEFNQNSFSVTTLRVPISPVHGVTLLLQAFYDLAYIPATQLEEQGAVAELRLDISRRWFATLGVEGKLSATRNATEEWTKLDTCYPVAWFQDCGFGKRLQTYSVVPRAIYDDRNSKSHPTGGYVADVRAKIAYSEDIGLFVKPDLRATIFWTFLRNFTVGLNTRMGFAVLPSGKTLPLFERFFLGGINVRGFEVDGVGPRLVDASNLGSPTNEAAGGDTLLNVSLELRFPILKDTGLFGVLFWDTGSLLAQQFTAYTHLGTMLDELLVENLRHSVGLGLRWLLSDNLPPFVLDYGIILDRRAGEPFGGLNLNIGYTF